MLDHQIFLQGILVGSALGLTIGIAVTAPLIASFMERDRPVKGDIAPGDVVQLRHGGPLWTVKAVDGAVAYVVSWDWKGSLRDGSPQAKLTETNIPVILLQNIRRGC